MESLYARLSTVTARNHQYSQSSSSPPSHRIANISSNLGTQSARMSNTEVIKHPLASIVAAVSHQDHNNIQGAGFCLKINIGTPEQPVFSTILNPTAHQVNEAIQVHYTHLNQGTRAHLLQRLFDQIQIAHVAPLMDNEVGGIPPIMLWDFLKCTGTFCGNWQFDLMVVQPVPRFSSPGVQVNSIEFLEVSAVRRVWRSDATVKAFEIYFPLRGQWLYVSNHPEVFEDKGKVPWAFWDEPGPEGNIWSADDKRMYRQQYVSEIVEKFKEVEKVFHDYCMEWGDTTVSRCMGSMFGRCWKWSNCLIPRKRLRMWWGVIFLW